MRLRGDVEVNSDDANETQLIDVLDTFCLGFARRDREAVLRVCIPELDLVVVTSEEPLLRGPTELRRFLDRYVEVRRPTRGSASATTSRHRGRSHGFSPRERRSRRVRIRSCNTRTE
jgi:hypothetical protein